MKQKIEEINYLIEKIKSSNILIIVEGKKDKAALQKLGINNIKELSKKPLFQIIEEIAEHNDECIILTDLDREGKLLYSKLNSNLQKHGVKINNHFREFLFKHTKLRQIEGIYSYLEDAKIKPLNF
ncbi:toprim domain-containing protein [Candidatus Woesearchaeota archaeon]|nr:toprim domain-containing protein [Candidatus Woesearchaeota archaeon]